MTIAGATGRSHGMTVKCGQQESQWYAGSCAKRGEAKEKGPHSRFKNNALYVTGLEDATKGGVSSEDLDIKWE